MESGAYVNVKLALEAEELNLCCNCPQNSFIYYSEGVVLIQFLVTLSSQTQTAGLQWLDTVSALS